MRRKISAPVEFTPVSLLYNCLVDEVRLPRHSDSVVRFTQTFLSLYFLFCAVIFASNFKVRGMLCSKASWWPFEFFLLLLFLEISVVNYVMYDTSDRGLLKRC